MNASRKTKLATQVYVELHHAADKATEIGYVPGKFTAENCVELEKLTRSAQCAASALKQLMKGQSRASV